MHDLYYNPVEIGKRVFVLRNKADMTQEQLAKSLNITIEHISRIELGKRGCSIDLLIEMVKLFDVTLDYLIFGRQPAPKYIKKIIQDLIKELIKLENVL